MPLKSCRIDKGTASGRLTDDGRSIRLTGLSAGSVHQLTIEHTAPEGLAGAVRAPAFRLELHRPLPAGDEDADPLKISVRCSDAAPATRALAWPVLSAGNGSFANGVYSVSLSFQVPGRSFILNHEIEGAGLVTNWIENDQVRFACAVADPVSAYRKIHVAVLPHHVVEWDPDDLGSHPLFTPLIVSASDIRHRVDAERDGLHPLWHGHTLELTRGSRIAICSTFAFQSGLLGLLKFALGKELPPGRFKIDPNHEEGFKFNVQLASDLFEYLQSHRREMAGGNIMTHVVSAALARLQREYALDDGEEGWKSYANLVALADWLAERKLGHWSDKDFDPALVATDLHPHQMPVEHGSEHD